MFRILANLMTPADLLELHPVDLTWWAERIWDNRQLGPPGRNPGGPPTLNRALETAWFSQPWQARNVTGSGTVAFDSLATPTPPIPYPHIIYAYMIESTGLLEVYRALLREVINGEKFGNPDAAAQWWLRCTEDLFFRPPPSFFIGSLRGDLRPHDSSIRRNAYYRFFGMGLPYPAGDEARGFVRPQHANTDFVQTLEAFFREVSLGIDNQNNTSGTNPRDDGTIADLATRLHDMLMARRTNGSLSREEFSAVMMADWLHLSVVGGIAWATNSGQSPVVDFLRAEAPSPEERIMKIGQRVGVPVHARTRSLIEIAEQISLLLLDIEQGTYNNPGAVGVLYTAPNPQEQQMRLIIRHWGLLTGRDPKARRVVSLPPPLAPGAAPTATNGTVGSRLDALAPLGR